MIRKTIAIIFFGLLLLTPTTSAAPSEENEYSEALLTSLNPAIQNALAGYYGKPILYTEPKILMIERLHKGHLSFNVTVQVKTSVGLHNSRFGKETMTIIVTHDSQFVQKFHHEDQK
ncbi:DUF3888 domain-containing protein [Paenibacillus dokdonensis]|uniref:DUF3888 domain-containing protein n=1 Tax=Paenibacillus dokdonensis TaxID=2567944 RepID=A0ABU6GK33_9BACL|nr:DUF3888 domain-containing protein [Paenibacillus dokdonensis]MEC0239472.1 DUF3888 domain-containing protein [Paenibacillus dokdonensis]